MLYAIGDIHGMYDALVDLLAKIKKHSEQYDEKHTIVFLGDYIDRGPDSKKVIDLFKFRTPIEGFEHVYIKGNHEQMLLDYLTEYKMNPNVVDWYAGNGGKETLKSYGLKPKDVFRIYPTVRKTLSDLESFIRSRTVPYYRNEKYVFVHAGFDPRMSFSECSDEHYMWVRDVFLHSKEKYYFWPNNLDEIFIVHGHTPVSDVDIRSNRINVDTGACYGAPVWNGIKMVRNNYGILSAIAIDTKTDKIEKIQTHVDDLEEN